MKKKELTKSNLLNVIGIVLLILVFQIRTAMADTLKISTLRIDNVSVRCYEKVELTFNLNKIFDNPFDPREIAIDATITSPKGELIVIPGFLNQKFLRKLDEKGVEVEEAAGEPIWTVRFSPTTIGRWKVKIIARTPMDLAISQDMDFVATQGKSHGFIRRAKDSRYFVCDDGTPFFPVGYNIAWAENQGNPTYEYDHWIEGMSQGGGNNARIWLQWNKKLSIEYNGERSGSGRYDPVNAWRMEHILDLCRQKGIKVMFTLDSPEPYMEEETWLGKVTRRPWSEWVHNAANGGTLKEAKELYTTEEGSWLIEQRLRYIAARWAWDPNIFTWELWNELDLFPGLLPVGWGPQIPDKEKLVACAVKWHSRMANYLRSVDPNRHLISTSFANSMDSSDIWRTPELDFVMSHCYNTTDLAGQFTDVVHNRFEFDSRPYIIGEFGSKFEWLKNLFDYDPECVHIRNGIWASVMAGSSGSAMFWGWNYPDDYMGKIHQLHGSLIRFCDGVPWIEAKFRPAELNIEKPVPLSNAGEPELRAVGLIGEHIAIVWLQNKLHNIGNIVDHKPMPSVKEGRVMLAGVLSNQKCAIEWWDTRKGEIIRKQMRTSGTGGLKLELSELAEDVAVKIKW